MTQNQSLSTLDKPNPVLFVGQSLCTSFSIDLEDMAVPHDVQISMQRLKKQAEQGNTAGVKECHEKLVTATKLNEALVTATKEKEINEMPGKGIQNNDLGEMQWREKEHRCIM